MQWQVRAIPGEELLEEQVEFADDALIGLVELADVAVGEEVVTEYHGVGGVDENLDDAVYVGSTQLWVSEQNLNLFGCWLPMLVSYKK